MKTFSDLIFKPHAASVVREDPGAEIAAMQFPQGRRISVIRGSKRFQSGLGTYEVLIDYGMRVELFGYQTSAQITELMKKLQEEK